MSIPLINQHSNVKCGLCGKDIPVPKEAALKITKEKMVVYCPGCANAREKWLWEQFSIFLATIKQKELNKEIEDKQSKRILN
jgi:DNA-directed RNA polymerase subunit RPC12/RpoP